MEKNPHAQALGRLGGIARALTLSKKRQRAISQQANRIKKARAKARKQLEAS